MRIPYKITAIEPTPGGYYVYVTRRLGPFFAPSIGQPGAPVVGADMIIDVQTREVFIDPSTKLPQMPGEGPTE